MAAHRAWHLAAIRARMRRILSELGYANRRMFDIRTGEHFMERAPEDDSRPRVTRRARVTRRVANPAR
jgi:hypothetical protein